MSFCANRRTFIALANVRANGVDHFLVSNVELQRRAHWRNAELGARRRVCDAAHRAAAAFMAAGLQSGYLVGKEKP